MSIRKTILSIILTSLLPLAAWSQGELPEKPRAEVLNKKQADSLVVQIDSMLIQNQGKPIDDPLKAALLSAVVPGLGQAYNGSYWKIPIIYAGFIGLGSSIYYWHYNFVNFRNALSAVADDNPDTVNPFRNINEANLNRRVEFYQRNRDFLLIITTIYYFLNVVEANVDGHLKTFDISDDISLNLDPHIGQFASSFQFGISLKLQLK